MEHGIPTRGWHVALLVTLLLVLGPASAQEDASTAEARTRVRRLIDEASDLLRAGKYADARNRAQQAVSLAETSLGPEDSLTADGLGWLGGAQEALGDLVGARATDERAVAINEKVRGPEAIETAQCLNSLAIVHREMGDLQGAKPLYERSLAIREKVKGPNDPSTAKGLANLATLLDQLGEYGNAKALLERALSIQEKALGADDPAIPITLGNLASVYHDMGDLADSKRLHERVLAIHERVLGPDHPETAHSLSDLAGVLIALGETKAAESLDERALAIWQKSLGAGHPKVASVWNDLGFVAQAEGDLRTARERFERALAIREKALGPNHPETADSLNNLAWLLAHLGDHRGARALHERTLAIYEKVYGPDHPKTALGLGHLAGDAEAMGDLELARSLYERKLKIQEGALGAEHPTTAVTLYDLACLLRKMGDCERATSLCERALAIRQKKLGEDHPDVARTLCELAALRGIAGNMDDRLKLLRRACAIQEKALGPDHLSTLAATSSLAVAMWGHGDRAEAEALLDRAWAADLVFLKSLLPALSSQERQYAMAERSSDLGCRLYVYGGQPAKSWSMALVWKGAALRGSATTLRARAGATEEERRLVEDLYAARRSLAGIAVSRTTSRPEEPPIAERLDAQRKRVEGLERDLAKLRPDLAEQIFVEVRPEDVQAALPEGTVLLDILENDGVLHAWVAGRQGEVAYFRLGKASEVEPLARRFREALEADDEKAWKEAGAALRAWLEKPIAAALVSAKELYVSPDGPLAAIPWGLLPDGEGFLVERLPVVCVSGGAGLVLAARTRDHETGNGLLALGDVDYAALDRPLPAIPATRGEVEGVAKRFHGRFAESPCSLLTGKDASEEAFGGQAPKARYVHVATHGFFDLEELRTTLGSGTRGLGGKTSAPFEAAREPKADVAGWNPLLLSGLVLAPSKEADGWLTAEELQDLDLRGVDLVVLSACETGRGELAAGEGVLGLSRALFIAGAREFMLSLWKVPDAETSGWMDAFYAGMWEDSLSTEEALRRAQLARLAADRQAGAFRPSTWGAWVLTR